MLTENMIEYRKDYYKNNRDYLLNYSKWYYRYLKYERGEITFEDLDNKPTRIKLVKKKKKGNHISTICRNDYKKRNPYNKVKKDRHLKKHKGDFIVSFD